MVTQNKVLMLLAVILIGTSYGTQVMPNTYTWYNVRSVVQQYNNYPAIVINDTGSDNNADAWINEYQNYSAVFRSKTNDDLVGLDTAYGSKDLSDGFCLYIVSFDFTKDNEDELFEKIQQHIPIRQHTLLTDMDGYVYFCEV